MGLVSWVSLTVFCLCLLFSFVFDQLATCEAQIETLKAEMAIKVGV